MSDDFRHWLLSISPNNCRYDMHLLHFQQGLLLGTASVVSFSRGAKSGSVTEERPAQEPSLSRSATRRGSMAPAAAGAAVPASTARTTRYAKLGLPCSACIAMALIPASCMELDLRGSALRRKMRWPQEGVCGACCC